MENVVYLANAEPFVKITGIKDQSFRYGASAGNPGELVLGSVFSAYIEFEYFLSNGMTIQSGDVLEYKRVYPQMDNEFNESQADLVSDIGQFNVTQVEYTRYTCKVTAFDNVIKLNAVFADRLKQLESSFPMTLANLVQEVATVADVTLESGFVDPTDDFWGLQVNYFYVAGITCRDIVKQIAELKYHFVYAYGNVIGKGDYGWNKALDEWLPAHRYVICPDDATYPDSHVYGITTFNIWYKENGLSLGDAIKSYDGVEIRSLSGEILGSDVGVDATSVYTIMNNNIVDNLIVEESGFNFDSIAGDIMLWLPFFGTGVSGTVRLFPFRFPYEIGSIVDVYDIDGTRYAFPIMAIDLTDSECVISAFGQISSTGETAGTQSYESSLLSLTAELNNRAFNGRTSYSLTSNTTKSFYLANNMTALVFGFSSASSAQFMAMVNVSSSGTVLITPILTANNITLTGSTNTLTVANTSNYVSKLRFATFNGGKVTVMD